MKGIIVFLLWCFCSFSAAESLGTIRVGVLQYGTLNWEMELIQRNDFATADNLHIEPVPLSSTQALLVALQGGKVDVILNDWLWVAKQAGAGRHFYYAPYSSAAGILVTQPHLALESADDWRGKRLGIAGGKANKNFVLYATYFQQHFGLDITEDLKLTFAAPPLLNALMTQGKLDAVINFWHYAAQLSAQGMTTAVTMEEVMRASGQTQTLPTVGWVFSKAFAQQQPERINAFLATSERAAKELMLNDKTWTSLDSFTAAYPVEVHPFLVDAYRAGRVTALTPEMLLGLERLYLYLREHPLGASLTGEAPRLSPELFWPLPHDNRVR